MSQVVVLPEEAGSKSRLCVMMVYYVKEMCHFRDKLMRVKDAALFWALLPLVIHCVSSVSGPQLHRGTSPERLCPLPQRAVPRGVVSWRSGGLLPGPGAPTQPLPARPRGAESGNVNFSLIHSANVLNILSHQSLLKYPVHQSWVFVLHSPRCWG